MTPTHRINTIIGLLLLLGLFAVATVIPALIINLLFFINYAAI